MILTRVARPFNGERAVLQQMTPEKPAIHMPKKEVGPLPNTIYKN